MNRDLLNNIKIDSLLIPATKTATATSTSIDLRNNQSCVIAFDIGNSGDTLDASNYWTLTVEEADTLTDGDYTTVAAGDLDLPSVGSGTSVVINAAAEDSDVIPFGYTGTKRYVRGKATATGTHPNGTPIGIFSIMGGGKILPESN